jgi:hypothetical protein
MAAIQLFAADSWGYWVEPCAGPRAGCRDADEQLVKWALEAWEKASGGGLTLSPAPRSQARIRVYWVSREAGLYGQTRGLAKDSTTGADIHVRPVLDGLGPDIASLGARDTLFRDTIVYLTALHESGHAFGLPHTREFDDIMYNFAFGGDILEYFARYRRKLSNRDSIRSVSGLSEQDIRRIRLTTGIAP